MVALSWPLSRHPNELFFIDMIAGEYPGDREILYTSELDTHVPDMSRSQLMPIFRSMFASNSVPGGNHVPPAQL